jgi:hypothetical protein
MDDSDDFVSDYQKSKQTLYELIENGKEALELAMEIARESEHPRSIEVLSGLIKNVADVNDKVMALNKSNKELISKKDEPKQLEGGVTANFLISGSTTDIQKMLAEKPVVIENDD